MRNIKYILISASQPEVGASRATARRDRNLGYHYIVTPECVVRKPIDIRQVSNFIPGQTHVVNNLNKSSIGIHCNGLLTDPAIRALLIDLLVELRFQFPEAKIMGVSEINGHEIHPRDAMNALRLELSNEP